MVLKVRGVLVPQIFVSNLGVVVVGGQRILRSYLMLCTTRFEDLNLKFYLIAIYELQDVNFYSSILMDKSGLGLTASSRQSSRGLGHSELPTN